MRRHVDKITKDIEKSKKTTSRIESFQDTISRLEERLTIALSRISLLEKSEIDKQDSQNDAFYSARAPTLITRPVSEKGIRIFCFTI